VHLKHYEVQRGIAMTKIIDLINYHSSYGKQVRLLEYYYNHEQNLEHMAGYRAIRSHREAFLELALAQLPDKTNREKVLMLTGSIGTGKSHLCLMLANYYSHKRTDIEMQSFFENWAERDPDGAEKLESWRGDGRYLVAPCDFGKPRSFEDMVLTAIERSLTEEGAEEIVFETHYKGAIRLLENWEERYQKGEPSGAYQDFLVYLGGDDPTAEVEKLKGNLRKNESTAMELFRVTYHNATGQNWAFRLDNLNAILSDLLSSTEFQKRYRGLVVIADEFGYALNENRVSPSVFQAFAEMSKDGVAGMQLMFVGVGHRRLLAYASNPQLQIDFRVVSDRIREVSLESEELEQIISSLVSPNTHHPAWEEHIKGQNDWLLTQMTGYASKLHLFDYLSEPELKVQIVENIYPMHPIATYCLTKISQEMGSDARSVFAFFRKFEPPLEGSYTWFVNNYQVTQPQGELNIYTPDLLARYFKESDSSTEITVRSEIRDHIRNYRAAVEEAQRFAYKRKLTKEIDSFTQTVLDLIFVYRVSNINVIQQTLEYGLNINRQENRKRLSSEIKSLIADKIIFEAPSGEYEFRRSDMVDLNSLIAEQRNELLEQALDLPELIKSLTKQGWDDYTDAKGHNQIYLGDKRLLRVFAAPNELSSKRTLSDGTEVSFWEYHDNRRFSQNTWNDQYDGTMVYVVCENEMDIKTAEQAVKSNDSESIIVGVPNIPLPIRDTVINLLAVLNFKDTEAYTKLDFQEKSMVDEMLGSKNQKEGRYGDFIQARDRYLSAKDLYWYREDGKTHLAFVTNAYAPADELMNKLFTKRITISHDYLSKAHPKSFSGSKDSALQEAVSRLITIDRPIQIDHSEKENRGEIRYLLKALVNEGVLIQEGDYDGNIAHYQLETNVDRYRNKFPALVDLIEELKKITRGDMLNIWGLLSNKIQAPYGLGPYALAVFTACVFRYFGDELRLKLDPQGYGYSPTNEASIIIDVATGRYASAVIERRLINPAISKLVDDVYQLFSDKPAQAGTHQTLFESWRSLLDWWKSLTSLEKATGIYEDDSTAFLIVDMMSKLYDDPAGYQIFLEEIKTIYGFNPDSELEESQAQEIIIELAKDKETIEYRSETIKSKLIQELTSLFQPSGTTYQDYKDAILDWYNDLHPDQKLSQSGRQSSAPLSLLDAIPKLEDLEKLLLETIPQSYGFKIGKVDDWTQDQSAIYIRKFSDALETINQSLPTIPAPIWETTVEASEGYQGVPDIRFRNSVSLIVSVPEGGNVVRISEGNDPTQAKQFETVEKSNNCRLEINESCSYSLVTQNEHGEFSKIIRLNFINLDDKNKLISEIAPKLDPGERLYRFQNPVDKQGLVVLLVDIVDKLKSDNRIPSADVLGAFEDVIQRIQKGLEDENK
jgi:hypothetical protein